MSYQDYDDPADDYDPDYVDEEEEFNPSSRQDRATARLSRQQIAFILGLNAIISLIISLAVVIVAGPSLSFQPGAAAPAEGIAVEGEPSQVPPGSPGTPAGLDSGTTASGGESPGGTSAEPTLYVVQSGDTLTSIAARFGVSLDDLMRANDLTDPDYVQVGQQLDIPIGGLPSVTPTFTLVPTPTDTPLPFNPPTPLPSGTAPPAEPAATVGPTPTPVPTLPSASSGEIRLALNILNVGDLANEAVQIVNQGPFVRLTGWTLSDEDGNVYTFPDFSLWGGGAINVHTAGGSNTTTDLYWGQPVPMWKPGELVTLRDAQANVIVTYMVPTL